MTKLEWQQLAERWLVDAKTLLDDHRWSAAYYLAGYAVECGLKACIPGRVASTPEVLFEDRRFSEKCWTHSISDLVKLAGLEATLAADTVSNKSLRDNWLVARDWTEQSRYRNTTHHRAKKLYRAVTANTNGVMQWIKAHW